MSAEVFRIAIKQQCTVKGRESRFCACVSHVTSLLFLTNQWRVDFRGKFAFVNRGYAVGQPCSVLSTSSLLIVRFHSFGIEMSSEDTGTESCKCNGVCSRKDGSKAKDCPCKTRGVFCTERCKCLVTGKNCQNQVGFLLFFSLTSYFICFRCIPNNSTQVNDYSNVF